MKKLGIIGGMGPAATAVLFSRIVDFTDVEVDQQHIDITILNRPSVPDRTAFILGNKGAQSFVPMLQEMASELEGAGCEILAMPCNAAHACHDEIISVLHSAELLNILHQTALFSAHLGCKCAGILATDGILASHAYQDAFVKEGLSFVLPCEAGQKKVMAAIYDYVKAGVEAPSGYLDDVCRDLISNGADCLILGCTELSLLGIPYVFDGVPVIDAMDVLAHDSVIACGAPAKDLDLRYI